MSYLFDFAGSNILSVLVSHTTFNIDTRSIIFEWMNISTLARSHDFFSLKMSFQPFLVPFRVSFLPKNILTQLWMQSLQRITMESRGKESETFGYNLYKL